MNQICSFKRNDYKNSGVESAITTLKDERMSHIEKQFIQVAKRKLQKRAAV